MAMIEIRNGLLWHSQLPSDGLKRLNRVVEKRKSKHVCDHVLRIICEEMNHLLYCSSAGHEPGYIYRAETETFEEIEVRGRVLGVSQTLVIVNKKFPFI